MGLSKRPRNVIPPVSPNNGDSLRELSVSSDGQFWVFVVARPENDRPWKWGCEVSLYHRLPASQPDHAEHLDRLVGSPNLLTDFSTSDSAIEYGRAVGLRMAEHAVQGKVWQERELPKLGEINGLRGLDRKG